MRIKPTDNDDFSLAVPAFANRDVFSLLNIFHQLQFDGDLVSEDGLVYVSLREQVVVNAQLPLHLLNAVTRFILVKAHLDQFVDKR